MTLRPLTRDEAALVRALGLPCYRCLGPKPTRALREGRGEVKVCQRCASDAAARAKKHAGRRR